MYNFTFLKKNNYLSDLNYYKVKYRKYRFRIIKLIIKFKYINK